MCERGAVALRAAATNCWWLEGELILTWKVSTNGTQMGEVGGWGASRVGRGADIELLGSLCCS